MNEQWKDVAGYVGYYQVSNFGKVRSMDRIHRVPKGAKSAYRRFLRGRILSQTIGNHGYPFIGLQRPRHKKKTILVARLVALAFVPNPNKKPCVNHLDFDTTNSAASNLEWCTYKENIWHSRNAGRYSDNWHAVGEQSGKTKLKNSDVLEIRRRHKIEPRRGVLVRLAADFDIDRTTVSRIVGRKVWKHLQPESGL